MVKCKSKANWPRKQAKRARKPGFEQRYSDIFMIRAFIEPFDRMSIWARNAGRMQVNDFEQSLSLT